MAVKTLDTHYHVKGFLTCILEIIHVGVALLGANTDMNEASSLTYENGIVDIYSNSWGPIDSGTVVSGPGPLTQMALQTGASQVHNSNYLHCFVNVNSLLCRDEMEKDRYMFGLMVMEVALTIVQPMAIHKVYTLYRLVPLVSMVILVRLMKNVLQRWFLRMSPIQTDFPLWLVF